MARRLTSAVNSSILLFLLAAVAFAQFPIRIPKINKPTDSGSEGKSDSGKKTDSQGPVTSGAQTAPSADSNSSKQGKRVYENVPRTSTPMLVQPRIFIELVCKNSYWKMANASNVTSWLPSIRLHYFYDERIEMSGTAEYYNPDGSLWFTEPLGWRLGALRSKDSWTLHDTKSTNMTGAYSVKVKDSSGALLWSGKFKVRKYPLSDRPSEKNKLGFSVEEDWLLPLGVVSFDSDDLTVGVNSVQFHVWLKGQFNSGDMSAELLHNGKPVAKRQVSSGAPGDDRKSTYSIPDDQDNVIRMWTVTFEKVLLNNGNWFNEEWYGDAHFIDRNPGEYTYRLYSSGTQIREFSFTVGPDGRFVRPAYSDSFMFPYHGILVPTKVLGNKEKWNQVNWKADLFFGNPVPGF